MQRVCSTCGYIYPENDETKKYQITIEVSVDASMAEMEDVVDSMFGDAAEYHIEEITDEN